MHVVGQVYLNCNILQRVWVKYLNCNIVALGYWALTHSLQKHAVDRLIYMIVTIKLLRIVNYYNFLLRQSSGSVLGKVQLNQ